MRLHSRCGQSGNLHCLLIFPLLMSTFLGDVSHCPAGPPISGGLGDCSLVLTKHGLFYKHHLPASSRHPHKLYYQEHTCSMVEKTEVPGSSVPGQSLTPRPGGVLYPRHFRDVCDVGPFQAGALSTLTSGMCSLSTLDGPCHPQAGAQRCQHSTVASMGQRNPWRFLTLSAGPFCLRYFCCVS